MISSEKFTEILIKNNLGPVVEVPCSYLKDFLSYLKKTKKIEMLNPVNEAVAMALATGFYLATEKIPIVSIQNSGFLISLNALTSLNQIYDIPIFYIITWRGQGGKGSDAPEHDITGEKLIDYLRIFNLPYEIADASKIKNQINNLSKIATKTKKPVALIIGKGFFEKIEKEKSETKYQMTRFQAIEVIKKALEKKAVFVSSTGFPTRDSYNVMDSPDFYVVGSMGHILGIALGVSRNTSKRVVAMDGDGSSFMHLGGVASIDPIRNKNLIYIVLDNESYESTGGQPTSFVSVDFLKIAKIFGFSRAYKARKKQELLNILKNIHKEKGSIFIQIKVNKGGEAGKRVSDKYTCPEIKNRFMKKLSARR